MDRRLLAAALSALAVGLLAGPSAASARTRAAAEPTAGTCAVKSLPSFVAQGEFASSASVGDIIEVSCNPFVYGAGSKVSVTASQLVSRCHNIQWAIPNPAHPVDNTRSVELTLDADGNANVGLVAGPNCAAGETLITVHMLEEPFESFTTSFTVLPPQDTPLGVTALTANGTSSQVQDAGESTVITLVEVEFPGASEKYVRLASEELFARCHGTREIPEAATTKAFSGTVKTQQGLFNPGIIWVNSQGYGTFGPEVQGLQLDNNGNGFMLALGEESCYPGTSLIEADLESKPFTTLTAPFTILSPRPRV